MTASARIRLTTILAGLAVPTVLLAQRPETHTVNKGDTLWDLAQQYLGDPLLWPEIYRLNTNVVEDPHWIYPGEVLRLVPGGDISAVPTADTPLPPAAEAEDQVAAADSAAPAEAEAEPAEPALAEPQVGDLAVEDQGDARDNVDLTPLVGTRDRRISSGPTLEVNLERAYRPIRRSEFFSSGFLTEGQSLPYGTMLGTVTPLQIEAVSATTTANLFNKVGITPPAGGRYQVGDSLLVVRVGRELRGYGDVILPTGLVRVVDVSRPEVVAEVVAAYGQILNGQRVLPVEKFTDPGNVRPVPISDGVHAKLLAHRDRQPLTGPQDVVFLDKGRADGVALGDVFELRSSAREHAEGAAEIEQAVATLQVVHVGEHHSTARVAKVVQPDIPPGTTARQIAKLPS